MDITKAVKGEGLLSLALVSPDETQTNLAARESGDHSPQLVVVPGSAVVIPTPTQPAARSPRRPPLSRLRTRNRPNRRPARLQRSLRLHRSPPNPRRSQPNLRLEPTATAPAPQPTATVPPVEPTAYGTAPGRPSQRRPSLHRSRRPPCPRLNPRLPSRRLPSQRRPTCTPADATQPAPPPPSG